MAYLLLIISTSSKSLRRSSPCPPPVEARRRDRCRPPPPQLWSSQTSSSIRALPPLQYFNKFNYWIFPQPPSRPLFFLFSSEPRDLLTCRHCKRQNLHFIPLSKFRYRYMSRTYINCPTHIVRIYLLRIGILKCFRLLCLDALRNAHKGQVTAIASTTSMTCQITARKSPAVASQPLIKTGVVQGTIATHGLIRPRLVKR